MVMGSLLASALFAIAHAASDEADRIRRFESALRPAVSVEGAPDQRWTLSERMQHWHVPGLSIAVIRNGKLAWAKAYGVLQAGRPERIDTQSVFSVGSVSKVGAAAMTLRLADAGRIDIDRDVNAYLTRWRLPVSGYTAVRPVTLRGILSHSAGLTVHGFEDFQPDDPLPGILDTLDGRDPARNEPVRVIEVPGTRFRYSGGGTTLEQLVIEEVTGKPFLQAAREYLFAPLGMHRSTYESPLPVAHGNIARAHDENGAAQALPRGYESMPEVAASGLWTTPSDFAKLVIAIIESYQGKKGGFLNAATARQMLTEVGRSHVGLGPFLYGQGLERRFWHNGSNDSYKARIEGHPGTGNGVVIFTNARQGDRLYPEVKRAVAAVEEWAPALQDHVRVPAFEISSDELRMLVGVYETQEAVQVVDFRHRPDQIAYRVSHESNRLYLTGLRAGEQARQHLIPTDALRFITEDGSLRVEFLRDYGGRISGLSVRVLDTRIEAVKVGVHAYAPPRD